MEQPSEELLSVQVNPGRLAEAKAIYTMTKWIFGGGLLYCLFEIVATLIYFSYSQPEKYRGYLGFYLQLNFTSWMTFVQIGIFFGQLFLYFRMVSHIKNGLERADGEVFDRSFIFMLRYSRLSMAGIVLSLLISAITIWGAIDAARMAAAIGQK